MSFDLNIDIYADGADINSILELIKNPIIKGITTNPTLMRKAGVENYELFARKLLDLVTDIPVSLEVFADDLDEMMRQAEKISSWGENVFVKIPVMNTKGNSTNTIIKKLSDQNIPLNITALMTIKQVEETVNNLNSDTPSIISVFAGRIADAGIDPMPIMKTCNSLIKHHPKCQLLWASSRELLNVIQANECGCHIITVDHGILKKLPTIGKDLEIFSRETVQMFYDDAVKSGFTL